MARWYQYLNVAGGFVFGTIITVIYLLLHGALVDEPSVIIPESPNSANFSSLSPLIFVGGFPRSGTTLMRVLLDTHPDVRCGPETRVIPDIMQLYHEWSISVERKILTDAGLVGEPIDRAVAAFVLEIMRRNGPVAPRLCDKDPLALVHLTTLARLFPNSKFVLMLRDGRAVAHSIIKQNITVPNIVDSDPWKILKSWNDDVATMMIQCVTVGKKRCLCLRYEDLVQRPDIWVKVVVDFLDLSWWPNMLRHSEVLNDSGIHLSRSESSSDQVVHPIYTHSLTKWCTDPVLPKDFIYRSHPNASMLSHLGYDMEDVPPTYDPMKMLDSNYLRK